MLNKWPLPEELYIDEKPGIRYYLIIAALSQLPLELDQQAYHREALRILNQFDGLVSLAGKYIKEGNIDCAVSVYEQLVEDGYDQVYPYKFLGEYYRDRGMQEESSRVLNVFCKLVENLHHKGINRPDLMAVKDNWI